MTSFGLRDVEQQVFLGRSPIGDAWYFTRAELSFIVSEEYTNTSAGDTSNLHFIVDSTADASAVVTGLEGNPSAFSAIRVYDAFDGDVTGGTEVDMDNDLLDSAGTATSSDIVTVTRGVTFTSTNTMFTRYVGGGKGASRGAGAAQTPPFIVEPGREVVVEVEKVDTDGDELAINIRWHEPPIVFSTTDLPFDPEDTV